MKKLTLLILLTFVLSGCFGFGKNDKEDAAADGVEVEDEDGRDDEGPPSFKDGDLYIEALKNKDAKYCAQISDEKLKEDCMEKVK